MILILKIGDAKGNIVLSLLTDIANSKRALACTLILFGATASIPVDFT